MYKGYLENLYDTTKGKKISASSQSFSFWYKYWKNALFNMAIHIFEFDTQGEVPNTEIEKILMSNGTIGATDKMPRSKGKIVVFYGNETGEPTYYFDMWKDYQVVSPKWSKVLKINRDVVVGWNNSTKMSIEGLIHTTAVELAHTDVSILNYMINSREKSVPIAGNRQQLEELKKYRENLSNGAVTPIYSKGMAMVDFVTAPSSSTSDLSELFEFKRNTLEMFLQNIGVKTNHEKKANLIEDEVSANDSLLVFNTEDMLARRQEFVDNVNKLFGRKWTVKKSKSLNYNLDAKGVGLNEQD